MVTLVHKCIKTLKIENHNSTFNVINVDPIIFLEKEGSKIILDCNVIMNMRFNSLCSIFF